MEFLNIVYLSKVNVASLNGAEGSGGNITPIKKISCYDGEEYVYVSGQALRRYLKETLRQLGNKISAVDEEGNPNLLDLDEQIFKREGKKEGKLGKIKEIKDKEKLFKEFIDLDLFGYMLPQGGRRWSAVKVSPLLSILKWKGEFDYLTRKQKNDDESKKSGNIVQIEMDTFNFMRGNIIVDVNAVGTDINEYTYEKKELLSSEEKKKRINFLIDAIKYFNGGAKQARNLEDLAPKFVVAIKQKSGNPFLLNSVKVDKKGEIIADLIIDELENFKEITSGNVYVGLTKGIFTNEQSTIEVFKSHGHEVCSVNEALDKIKA